MLAMIRFALLDANFDALAELAFCLSLAGYMISLARKISCSENDFSSRFSMR
jgi:hypothetical protein